MIRVEVQSYCEHCRIFEADVERPAILHNMLDEELVLGDTVIRCARRRQCENIKKYLEKHK